MIRKKVKQFFFNEEGTTLVEVLASFVLITMIVTTFLYAFIQAASTNQRVSLTNQATFLAQEKLEILTQLKTVDELTDALKPDGESKNGFLITSERIADKNTIQQVIVTVAKGGKTYAKMETNLFLQATPTTP